MKRVRIAFTLLELLVVIAVIAILAAMLFPVLSGVQEKAYRTTCMNNMKECHRAIFLFAMDHSEAFPTTLVSLATSKYMDDPEIFCCRSDKWRKAAPAITNLTAETANQYCSYNLFVKDADEMPLSPASPSMTLLLCDKNGGTGNVTVAGFGGNHKSAGGHVLKMSGAVRWINKEEWSNALVNVDVDSVIGY